VPGNDLERRPVISPESLSVQTEPATETPVLRITIDSEEAQSSLSSSTHTLESPEFEYTPSRVHFRPRVRITSGISRHRHSTSSPIPITSRFPHALPFTPDSSVSGSPSSSISAPLRSDEETNSGWGPLGRRVALFTENARQRCKNLSVEERGQRRQKKLNESPLGINERTPLIRSYPRPRRSSDSSIGSNDSLRAEVRGWQSKEIDRVFGTWPGRLLNHHWWWWHVEPIISCRCLEEPEDEY